MLVFSSLLSRRDDSARVLDDEDDAMMQRTHPTSHGLYPFAMLSIGKWISCWTNLSMLLCYVRPQHFSSPQTTNSANIFTFSFEFPSLTNKNEGASGEEKRRNQMYLNMYNKTNL
jgi:hypothetical protein